MINDIFLRDVYIIGSYFKWDLKKIYDFVFDDSIIEAAKKYGKNEYKMDVDRFYDIDLDSFFMKKDSLIYTKIVDVLNNCKSRIDKKSTDYYILYKMSKMNKEEAFEFLINLSNNKDVNTHNLNLRVENFCEIFCNNNKKIYKGLKDKFTNYNTLIMEYKRSVKKNYKNYIIEKYSKVIDSFIDIEYKSVDEFCEINSICKEELEKIIKVVRSNDRKLYNKYKLVEFGLSKGLDRKTMLNFNNLYLYIQYGINDNGEYGTSDSDLSKFRKFDILDYFTIFKIDPTYFYVILKYMDYRFGNIYISKFFNNYSFDVLKKDDILNHSFEYGCSSKYDEETLRNIKIKVIDYLESKGYLLYSCLFMKTYQRYLDGMLDIECSNDKIKRK